MLSSHAYYAFKVNQLFTNYAENFFFKYLIFYACACPERRLMCNYIVLTQKRVRD